MRKTKRSDRAGIAMAACADCIALFSSATGGFGATAMGIVPYAGVSFFTYDTLKHVAGEFYARKQHA